MNKSYMKAAGCGPRAAAGVMRWPRSPDKRSHRRISMIRRAFIGIVMIAAAVLSASPAGAQSFGIGPRFSFVRGNAGSGTPSTQLVGGVIRLMTGAHTALEGSLDYRAYMNETGT